MKSIRFHAPRTCAALFAAALLLWALVEAVHRNIPVAPTSASGTAQLLLAGGTLVAPLAVPVLLTSLAEQRD